LVEGLFKVAEKSRPEQAGKDADGQEESRAARYPVAPIRSRSAAGDDAVQVGVIQEGLVPGVQDGQEADLSSKVLGIRGDGTEGFGGRPEKQSVKEALVLQGQRSDLFGKGEDHVIVRRGKQFGLARLEPPGFGERLTLGALAVAAGVVGVSLRAARIAYVDVAAQEGSPAEFDGAHGMMLLERHESAVDLPIGRAALAEDVGHFQGRPGHGSAGSSGRLAGDSKGLGAAQTVLRETWV
jgi:hypothetical protein